MCGKDLTSKPRSVSVSPVRLLGSETTAFVSASLCLLMRSFLPSLLLLGAAEGLPYALGLPEPLRFDLLASGGMRVLTGSGPEDRFFVPAVLSVLALVFCVYATDRLWCGSEKRIRKQ